MPPVQARTGVASGFTLFPHHYHRFLGDAPGLATEMLAALGTIDLANQGGTHAFPVIVVMGVSTGQFASSPLSTIIVRGICTTLLERPQIHAVVAFRPLSVRLISARFNPSQTTRGLTPNGIAPR
jgi:hypothetical protein